MWAYALRRPYEFEKLRVAAPSEADLGENEALLRVLVGGICGSDLPFFRGMPPYSTLPGVPLHEVVGEVVASRDPALHPGSTVVGWATQRNALSELIVVRGGDVHPFAPDLSPSVAIMLQPLACVIFAADCLTGVAGSTAAVIGQGPIGVLFSHVLKQRGAAKVIGIDRIDRSDVAGAFGVDECVWSASDAWAARPVPETDLPNVIVEAVGHQVSTLADATQALRFGGQLYYFGIPDDPVYPFPMAAFLRKNATLFSGFTHHEARRDALVRAEAYLRASPEIIKPYLTSTFSFDEVEEAFMVASTPSAGRLKVTLEL
jgi:threonine dehydrogenase-like Zn-dependent dehydrogenase